MPEPDNTVKQRLIGALVLVFLAAILLPLVLNLDGEYVVDTRTHIPDRPDIVPAEIGLPKPVTNNSSSKTADQMFRFNASRDDVQKDNDGGIELKAEPPGLSELGVPKSWILQIGSFSEPLTAKQLTQKLLADGYRAYSRQSTTQGKSIYRVYVGPKIRKQDMLDEKNAIERKHKVKTLLLRFEP